MIRAVGLRAVLALGCLALSPRVPAADTNYGRVLTAGDFITLCAVAEGDGAAMTASRCEAYIIGFLESAGLLEYANQTPHRYCLPVTVSPREIAVAVLDRARRAEPDMPAAMLLRAYLEETHPCPPGVR